MLQLYQNIHAESGIEGRNRAQARVASSSMVNSGSRTAFKLPPWVASRSSTHPPLDPSVRRHPTIDELAFTKLCTIQSAPATTPMLSSSLPSSSRAFSIDHSAFTFSTPSCPFHVTSSSSGPAWDDGVASSASLPRDAPEESLPWEVEVAMMLDEYEDGLNH